MKRKHGRWGVWKATVQQTDVTKYASFQLPGFDRATIKKNRGRTTGSGLGQTLHINMGVTRRTTEYSARDRDKDHDVIFPSQTSGVILVPSSMERSAGGRTGWYASLNGSWVWDEINHFLLASVAYWVFGRCSHKLYQYWRVLSRGISEMSIYRVNHYIYGGAVCVFVCACRAIPRKLMDRSLWNFYMHILTDDR